MMLSLKWPEKHKCANIREKCWMQNFFLCFRYMFRVKSENVYGMSEPGEESDPFDVASATTDR